MPKTTELIKLIFDRTRLSKTFGQNLKNVKLLNVTSGKVQGELKIAEEHLNLGGTLHGGFSSTVIDCFTTYALMSYKNTPPGVSVDLHVTFLNSAKIDEEVLIDAKILKVGKRLAFLDCEITNKESGKLLARGFQTKFVG